MLDYKLFWNQNDNALFWATPNSVLFWPIATTMPTVLGPSHVRFSLRTNTQVFESPVSMATQTLELSGARWEATFKLPPMNRAEASAWIAWLTEQSGRAGRFYLGDPSATSPRGVATGTPVVSGGGQTGRILVTSGWTPSVTGILRAGDYFAFRTPTGWNELHMIIADANSRSDGKAYLQIIPPIRESPANGASIITASPTCIMRLLSDEIAAWDIEAAGVYGLEFHAIEVFS